MEFTKPPKSFEEQLKLLVERGMSVNDEKSALHYLSHINYYRLEAYWLPFEESRDPHKFLENTNFEVILNHYLFDRELRLLLLDAIERIEISFRTQWAYHISHAFGSHGYLANTKGVRKSESRLSQYKDKLKEYISISDEVFIKHYRDTYDEEFPPVWVSCEVISLGLLSKFYSNLSAYKVRQNIAATYQFDEGFLEGFLEHLTYVRNVCAHHSRLWNRHLTKKMPLPKGKPAGLKENIYIDEYHKTEHKIYNTLVVIQHLMGIVCPEGHWAKRLESLIEGHNIDEKRMGFPEDWKTRPIWKRFLV